MIIVILIYLLMILMFFDLNKDNYHHHFFFIILGITGGNPLLFFDSVLLIMDIFYTIAFSHLSASSKKKKNPIENVIICKRTFKESFSCMIFIITIFNYVAISKLKN